MDFDEHLTFVIAALAERRDELMPAAAAAGRRLRRAQRAPRSRSSSWRATRPARSCWSSPCACSTPSCSGLELELERFDLSLENRRATGNGVVDEAAAAMREAGLGLKAATITPEGAGDVGSPNRILREEVDGKVIVRTGRRMPGVAPIAGVHHPISVVRMAVDDAYGAEEWREGEPAPPTRWRTAPSRSPAHLPRGGRVRVPHRGKMGARVYGGPKWTVSPGLRGHVQGGDGRRGGAPSRRSPTSRC